MIDRNRTNHLLAFDVTVGLSRVQVEGHTHEEAIRAARLALSAQNPRLYDVIKALDASQFRVEASTNADGIRSDHR